MRKTAFAAAITFLMLVAAPVFAVTSSRNMTDDVIKMSKSGVAEETILDFVNKAGRYDVTADDVVAMSEAGVSRNVIRAVVRNADTSSPGARDRDRDRVVERQVIVSPSYGYAPYYGYGYWPYYDPFWYGYGPTFSLSLGWGGWYGGHWGGYRGGGFRHHR
jgi:hypothetical protein